MTLFAFIITPVKFQLKLLSAKRKFPMILCMMYHGYQMKIFCVECVAGNSFVPWQSGLPNYSIIIISVLQIFLD